MEYYIFLKNKHCQNLRVIPGNEFHSPFSILQLFPGWLYFCFCSSFSFSWSLQAPPLRRIHLSLSASPYTSKDQEGDALEPGICFQVVQGTEKWGVGGE